MESLQQEHRVEVALCARPAQVSLSDDVLNIHFRKNLTGQYACLSDDDNRLEIERLLTKRIGRPIQCNVTIGTRVNKNDQISEEQNWLSKLRDKVAPITNVPAPDPAHDMTFSQSDPNNNDTPEIRSRIDSTSVKSYKSNDSFNQISIDGSLLLNERDEVHKTNRQSASNDSKEITNAEGLADSCDRVEDLEIGGQADLSNSIEDTEIESQADFNVRKEVTEVGGSANSRVAGLSDSDDILQGSATNEQPWLIQLRQKIAAINAINDKSHGTSHQEINLNSPHKQIEMRPSTLSSTLRKNIPHSEDSQRAGSILSLSKTEQMPNPDESYNRRIPPHLYGDGDIPYFDEQDVPPLTDDDAPYL